MYCNRSGLWVCLFVCVFACFSVCLWVCYHDNSKLRASILTKLGLLVKVVTVSICLNFRRPAPPGRGSAAGRNFFFGSALLQPARSVCVSLSAFFHVYYVFIFSLDCSVPVWLSTCCRTGDNNVDIINKSLTSTSATPLVRLASLSRPDSNTYTIHTHWVCR